MGVTIGIDIGGSNTKIVGLKDGEIFSPVHVRANDPVSSLYGAFGRFVTENGLALSDIGKIMITGVGAAFIKDKIYGISTARVDEFLAFGLGGLYLTGLKRAVVVSLGTGTAFAAANENTVRHLGGTGVGGGTLTGLASRIIQVSNFDDIVKMAEKGDLKKIDLMVKDITAERLSNLTPEVTAANFGKISDLATKNDLALGIINLVCQTVGMMAVFAARTSGDDTVVLTGYLSTMPQAKQLYDMIEQISGLRFIIPDRAEFATAIGAAISHLKRDDYTNI